MFKKLFGGGRVPQRPAGTDDPQLRPMQDEDIPKIVEIIGQTDEDDAENAEEMFRGRQGCQGMFVLWYQGVRVGVTGFEPSEGGPNVVWLSWTYMDEDASGDGLGRFMVEELLGMLNRQKVRKIFISTSDYKEDGELIYGAAHAFYEQLGAEIELTVPDFYDDGENRLIYGLNNPGMAKQESFDGLGDRGVTFLDLAEDDESEDVGAIAWEETEDGSVNGLDQILGLAHSRNYRQCVVALPADISDIATPSLEQNGFKRVGALTDFYALELAQVWWLKQVA